MSFDVRRLCLLTQMPKLKTCQLGIFVVQSVHDEELLLYPSNLPRADARSTVGTMTTS